MFASNFAEGIYQAAALLLLLWGAGALAIIYLAIASLRATTSPKPLLWLAWAILLANVALFVPAISDGFKDMVTRHYMARPLPDGIAKETDARTLLISTPHGGELCIDAFPGRGRGSRFCVIHPALLLRAGKWDYIEIGTGPYTRLGDFDPAMMCGNDRTSCPDTPTARVRLDVSEGVTGFLFSTKTLVYTLTDTETGLVVDQFHHVYGWRGYEAKSAPFTRRMDGPIRELLFGSKSS